MSYFFLALRKYACFKGRASRKEYWWFVLMCLLLNIVLYFIDIPVLLAFLNLFLLCPTLAVTSRRLHDVGLMGWLSLFILVPFGNLVLLYVLVRKGDDFTNKYGESPLY